MWKKWLCEDEGLPRAKIDAVVKVIDRYLSEEAELQRLHTDKQTMQPRTCRPRSASRS